MVNPMKGKAARVRFHRARKGTGITESYFSSCSGMEQIKGSAGRVAVRGRARGKPAPAGTNDVKVLKK
jgi:hypothetical protein